MHSRMFSSSKKHIFSVTVVVLSIVALPMPLLSSQASNTTLRSPNPSIKNSTSDLPKEEESFSNMRKSNRTFVDKTHFLSKLIDRKQKFLFLCRPRRFGKSTFLQMMRSFFRGEKHLFKNTLIYSRGNTQEANGQWSKHPVIYLDFSSMDFNTDSKSLDSTKKTFGYLLYEVLQGIGKEYNVTNFKLLRQLIPRLKEKLNLPVVILIDEYDWPLNYALQFKTENDTDLTTSLRDILEGILLEIRDCAEDLRLVFVTGVSKITLDTIQTNPVTFEDLTTDEEFRSILGFSRQEVDTYFNSHVQNMADQRNQTTQDIINELNKWYEGYSFTLGNQSKVLNPVSVINCLRQGKFSNYWCRTNPTLLYRNQIIEQFYQQKLEIQDFECLKMKRSDLFRVKYPNVLNETIPLPIYMVFAGYLTIHDYNPQNDTVTLSFPNREIKETMTRQVETYIPEVSKFIDDQTEWTERLKEMMDDQEIREIIKTLKLFGFSRYSPVTQRLIRILDAARVSYVRVQDPVEGNMAIRTKGIQNGINYAFGLKWGTALEAINKLMKYVQKYPDSFQERIYLIGVNFTKQGQIEDWISLPCSYASFFYDEVKASNKYLEKIVEGYEIFNITAESKK